MKEQLSALVDAEIRSDVETADLLGQLRTSEELRDSWDMYHLIGDAMRGTAGSGMGRQQFAANLAAEPTVLAPNRTKQDAAGPRTSGARWLMPVAASLAAVVFVGWMASAMLPTQSVDVAQAPKPASLTGVATVVSAPDPAGGVASPIAPSVVAPAPGTVVAAPSIALPPAAIPVASGVDDYLWAHQRFAPAASAYRVQPVRHEAR